MSKMNYCHKRSCDDCIKNVVLGKLDFSSFSAKFLIDFSNPEEATVN